MRCGSYEKLAECNADVDLSAARNDALVWLCELSAGVAIEDRFQTGNRNMVLYLYSQG